MKQKVSAMVMGRDLCFVGVQVVGGAGSKPGDVRKWFDAHKKRAPWVCRACEMSVGEDGEQVVVYVDLDDPNCFQVLHRRHDY